MLFPPDNDRDKRTYLVADFGVFLAPVVEEETKRDSAGGTVLV